MHTLRHILNGGSRNSLFKYACMARSNKLKESSIKYAALGRVVEEGGLLIAVVARYSVIPGHCELSLCPSYFPATNALAVITAIFATCGMKLWVFCASAIISMPQNFVNVYIGSYFEAKEEGKSTTASNVVNYLTIAVTIAVTIVAMRYIDAQINKVKPQIVHERRKRRQFQGSSTTFGASTTRLYAPPAAHDPEAQELSRIPTFRQ